MKVVFALLLLRVINGQKNVITVHCYLRFYLDLVIEIKLFSIFLSEFYGFNRKEKHLRGTYILLLKHDVINIIRKCSSVNLLKKIIFFPLQFLSLYHPGLEGDHIVKSIVHYYTDNLFTYLVHFI